MDTTPHIYRERGREKGRGVRGDNSKHTQLATPYDNIVIGELNVRGRWTKSDEDTVKCILLATGPSEVRTYTLV